MDKIRLTGCYGKYPIIYRVLAPPSGARFLNHQQYHNRCAVSNVMQDDRIAEEETLKSAESQRGKAGWKERLDDR